MASQTTSALVVLPAPAKPLDQAEVGLLAFKELRAHPDAFLDWLRHRPLVYINESDNITVTGDGSIHNPYKLHTNLAAIEASISALVQADVALQEQIDTLNETVQEIIAGDVSSSVLQSTDTIDVQGTGTVASPYRMTVIPPTIIPYEPNFTLLNELSFRVRYTKDPITNEVTLVIPNSGTGPTLVTALSLGGNCPAEYFPSRAIHNRGVAGAILITCMIGLERDPGNNRLPALWLASFDEGTHKVGGSLRTVDGSLVFPEGRYGVNSVVMKWFTDPVDEEKKVII